MAIFVYEMYREVLMAFAGQCISILCTHTASLRKCCLAAVVPYYHGGIQAHRGNVLYSNVFSTISDEYSFSCCSICTLGALGYPLCTI